MDSRSMHLRTDHTPIVIRLKSSFSFGFKVNMPESTVVFVFIKDIIAVSTSSRPKEARPVFSMCLNSTGFVDLSEISNSIPLFITVRDFDVVAGYAVFFKGPTSSLSSQRWDYPITRDLFPSKNNNNNNSKHKQSPQLHPPPFPKVELFSEDIKWSVFRELKQLVVGTGSSVNTLCLLACQGP